MAACGNGNINSSGAAASNENSALQQSDAVENSTRKTSATEENADTEDASTENNADRREHKCRLPNARMRRRGRLLRRIFLQ